MNFNKQLVEQHQDVTRRYFLKIGTACATGLSALPFWSNEVNAAPITEKILSDLEYLTADKDFINYGRGKPPPYKLPIEKRREVGLTPETWQLEIVADPESNSVIEHPLTKENGAAFNWQDLMNLAKNNAVRFMSVMSCTNGRKPCGMGLWEGVPLRDVIWKVNPGKNIRRVFYYGFHNNDPQQRFQSSLPLGRVLEDPPGEHPVILCYKLNNRWLTPVRGGPVRIIVPELYANKSVKWLQRIVLTNNDKLNDTYALWNNDTESHLKTWACFIHTPEKVKAGNPIFITGLAHVGMSGFSKVQYCLHPKNIPYTEKDPYYTSVDWKDAELLPPPDDWGGDLPDGELPSVPLQIDPKTNQPYQWPMRNTLAHWAVVIDNASPGKYDVLCRTIDNKGIAQPMPRPYLKSGYNAIQRREIIVEA